MDDTASMSGVKFWESAARSRQKGSKPPSEFWARMEGDRARWNILARGFFVPTLLYQEEIEFFI
jgi:hypothetical protein